MEDLLFERLDRVGARVEPRIVLQDLFLVDRVVRPVAGPSDPDYRVPYLAEALEARRFFESADERWEAIDLYDDVCRLYDVESIAALEAVLKRFDDYRLSRTASSTADR